MKTPFKHPSGLATGDEVWVRAVVTDPCTSGVGVKVQGSHGQPHAFMKPADVRADHVELTVTPGGALFQPQPRVEA